MNKGLTLFFFATLLCGALSSHARVLETEYLSVNLPDNWKCEKIPPNWICEPASRYEKKFAILTLTNKEAGALDQLEQFKAHLSKPRPHQMGSSTPVMSQVLQTVTTEINGHKWVQSTHLSSEVNNFMTIYLATVKNPLAVMITMSAEKNQWSKYRPLYEKVISSVKLKTVKLKTVKLAGGAQSSGGTPIQVNENQANFNSELLNEEVPVDKIPQIYWIGLGLAGLTLLSALYIFLKR